MNLLLNKISKLINLKQCSCTHQAKIQWFKWQLPTSRAATPKIRSCTWTTATLSSTSPKTEPFTSPADILATVKSTRSSLSPSALTPPKQTPCLPPLLLPMPTLLLTKTHLDRSRSLRNLRLHRCYSPPSLLRWPALSSSSVLSCENGNYWIFYYYLANSDWFLFFYFWISF